jgi:hypothetical protein
MKINRLYFFVILAALALILNGCGNDNPVSAFEPEIINTADAFQFQVTDAKNVTATLTYHWENPNNQATIDHSTALSEGTASVEVFDADSNLVYQSPLVASGTDQSASGTAGFWIITVIFDNFSGTANFRVEKL